VTTDLVYGRRAVREALRGRREVLEVWATERAAKAEPWLSEARPKLKAERELTERADTRDHQGVLALVEPYRYADAYELAAAQRPLLAVLDRVTDPRNLGAVARSADGAGATGMGAGEGVLAWLLGMASALDGSAGRDGAACRSTTVTAVMVVAPSSRPMPATLTSEAPVRALAAPVPAAAVVAAATADGS